MTNTPIRSILRSAGVLAGVLCLGLLVTAPALAQGPVDINSSGPLTDIWIGDDLTCQIAHAGESDYQFFPPGSTSGHCGTLLSADGQLDGFLGDDWIPVSQSGVTGAGTSQSPFQITTEVQAQDSSGDPINLTVTEVDRYTVGDEYYRTDMTVQNTDPSTTFTGLRLYHAADCYLQGSDQGYGFADPSNGSVACTQSANNQPPALLEEFAPLTPGDDYMESFYSTVFEAPETQADFPNTCDCTTHQDNGEGIDWDIASLGPGQSQSFAMLSSFSPSGVTNFPISATGGQGLSGAALAPINGTVATFTDPDSSDPASEFSATIDWGDGSASTGTVTGGNGNFTVTGSHTYAAAGSYTLTVTISQAGGSSSAVTDTASITGAPGILAPAPPTISATAAGVTGSVNPGGLPTNASFQYGLDPKYSGGGPIVYTSSSAPQSVGSDFSSHIVSATLSGLVPNAQYHARLVATNADGMTFGPDMAFTTRATAPPAAPTLGKTVNLQPVTGVVLIKLNGKFVPLTEVRQIPTNTEINALRGTIELATAINGGSGARDATAKGKKHKPVKTQSGTFGGAVFKITQAHNGLATLSIVESAFKGAPGYSECTRKKAGDASASALSSRVLQLLHASAHGKFSTRGRYSSATVRGTKWTVADRCDGTLTHDITDSVVVTDFVRHKTIILHAGQSYLTKPRKPTR